MRTGCASVSVQPNYGQLNLRVRTKQQNGEAEAREKNPIEFSVLEHWTLNVAYVMNILHKDHGNEIENVHSCRARQWT